MHRLTHMNVVYQFSITDLQKSGALKKHTLIISQFHKVNLNAGLTRVKKKNVGRAAFLLEALRSNQLPESVRLLACVKLVPVFVLVSDFTSVELRSQCSCWHHQRPFLAYNIWLSSFPVINKQLITMVSHRMVSLSCC